MLDSFANISERLRNEKSLKRLQFHLKKFDRGYFSLTDGQVISAQVFWPFRSFCYISFKKKKKKMSLIFSLMWDFDFEGFNVDFLSVYSFSFCCIESFLDLIFHALEFRFFFFLRKLFTYSGSTDDVSWNSRRRRPGRHSGRQRAAGAGVRRHPTSSERLPSF